MMKIESALLLAKLAKLAKQATLATVIPLLYHETTTTTPAPLTNQLWLFV